LNKRISNEVFLRASRIIRGHGMAVRVGNMFGLPGETVEDAFATIELNLAMGTRYLGAAMLLPFPGTPIEKIALARGYLDAPLDFRNLPPSTYDTSAFKHPDIETLTNVMSVAQLCSWFPRLLPAARRLVRLRCRWLFRILNWIGLLFRFAGERRVGVLRTLAIFWRYRKNVK
jgi:radical SAM superfamily enzyme YgiQ (UPF0313 family)